MTPRIAVITPGPVANVTPLLSTEAAGAPTAWNWYHRCLTEIGEVDYVPAERWVDVHGYAAVLVHEALGVVAAHGTVRALAALRERNGRVVWVEPHQRSTFAPAVLSDGFFDAVDLVLKYQLMRWADLVDGLGRPDNDLAPWALHGHTSIRGLYDDGRLFGIRTSPQVIEDHLTVDLSAHYGTRISPLPRPFTLPPTDSWYGQTPSRQGQILPESELSLALNPAASGVLGGLLVGLLASSGLEVKLHRSPVRAAATARACLAVGPVHHDSAAADILRFDTLAVLPHDERYLDWEELRTPRETYLPLEGFASILRDGGRTVDGAAAHAMVAQLASDLADADLCERILAGQRRAHAALSDPHHVAGRLGIATEPALAARAPAPVPFTTGPPASTAPVVIAGISTADISVVIQGALGRGTLAEEVVASVRRELPGAEVIVSTWEGERALGVDVEHRIESADPGAPWQVHVEWPSNTNRLLRSTAAGLAAATRPYALKLRTDTPLSGTGFIERFAAQPPRGDTLALLRDRMAVITMYCWNPDGRPYGLFAVADTVNFGWTEDLRAVWARELDPEPETSTWFETHPRPDPDPCPWMFVRYTPEQLLWAGFLRRHVAVPFEHFGDDTPAARVLAELSMANNVLMLEPESFGVELPKFADRATLAPGELYTETDWRSLWERWCLGGPTLAVSEFVAALSLDGLPRDRGELDGLAARALADTEDPLADARRFVVLADAEELFACEQLLVAYADGMREVGHATLAIDAGRLDEQTTAPRIQDLVVRCGLAERDDLDLIALVGRGAVGRRRRVQAAAAAQLSRHERAGELPAFGPGSIASLRALALASA